MMMGWSDKTTIKYKIQHIGMSVRIRYPISNYRTVDTIPVHEASTSGRNKNSFQYVLPLVKAAIEHNVFEEDERGGLLVDDPTLERNALQDLAIEGQVDTMKELRANSRRPHFLRNIQWLRGYIELPS